MRQCSILDLKRANQEKSPWVKIKKKPGLKRRTRLKSNCLTKTKQKKKKKNASASSER